jgi:hypothetical protein
VRRRGSHIFLDNRLTDGGEVVSLTRLSPLPLGRGSMVGEMNELETIWKETVVALAQETEGNNKKVLSVHSVS